jgi:1-acyl-sn-glycerol-3-phosphate acyltransferase
MLVGQGVVRLLARLEVTGDVAGEARHSGSASDGGRLTPTGATAGRGLILAANHISPFDPIVIAAACRKRGIAPRFLANAGLFRTPVVGPMMRAAGHIRVDRGEPTAGAAVSDSMVALAQDSAVMIYPEGRISLDPGLWPERGRTGVGRLALASGAPVVPVAMWGAHEVLPYAAPVGMWPMIWRALRRRPVVRVHFGPPVDLSDLERHRHGAAQSATDRIIGAIVDELKALRADEPDRPRFIDPSRPTETRRSYRDRRER